jgi:hypothetical protein
MPLPCSPNETPTPGACLLTRWSMLLAASSCLLAVSCSDQEEPPPDDEDEGGEQAADDAGEVDAGRDTGRPTRDAGRMDARVKPMPVADPQCTPGRYEGDFSCLISGFLPWNGKMSFSLVEESMNAGEFATLTIVPGTQISGSDDSFQGMFTATLAGSFDCRTGVLTGALEDGTYLIGGFMEYQLMGPLEGSYVHGDGGTAGFDGTMGPLTSANFEAFGDFGPSAMCTWKAERTGEDTGPDAGR